MVGDVQYGGSYRYRHAPPTILLPSYLHVLFPVHISGGAHLLDSSTWTGAYPHPSQPDPAQCTGIDETSPTSSQPKGKGRMRWRPQTREAAMKPAWWAIVSTPPCSG